MTCRDRQAWRPRRSGAVRASTFFIWKVAATAREPMIRTATREGPQRYKSEETPPSAVVDQLDRIA